MGECVYFLMKVLCIIDGLKFLYWDVVCVMRMVIVCYCDYVIDEFNSKYDNKW